jgi:hypothetical protein
MDDILSNYRKGDIHIFASTQCPAELGPGLLSNSANKIVFRLASGKDVEAMQRHMGVTDKEEKEYFYNLDQRKREVIVEFTKRARPFVARILERNLLQPLTKHELYENSIRLIQKFSPVVPRLKSQDEKQDQKINDDEKKWLMATYLNQYRLTITQIYDAVEFSSYKGDKIAEHLLDKNLIKLIDIIKGKGTSKYPVLLPEAYKILNVEERKFEGKGCGYEHLIWQHIYVDNFKEFKPVIELNRGGKCVDVAFEYQGKLIALEVAISSAHEKENIEKDINLARADFVIIGCKDDKVKEEVLEIIADLPEDIKHKARVWLLAKILKSEVSELIK